ncbi:MAG: hypothetical protein ABJB97_08145 [Acidobacteriota bacterium]
MTARTSPPPSPEIRAQRFVATAMKIIVRLAAPDPEPERRAARVQLVALVGAGWHVEAGGEVLCQGESPELAETAVWRGAQWRRSISGARKN